MGLSLIFETATSKPFFLVEKGGTLLDMFEFDSSRLSDQLFPAMQKFLPSSEPIDFVAISTGPGSFTGMRIGASIAKTLSYAIDTPLIPFSSLETHCPKKDGSFVNIIDAKSGGIYSIAGMKSEELCSFETPKLTPISEAKSLIEEFDSVLSLDHTHLRVRLDYSKIGQGLIDPNFLIRRLRTKFLRGKFIRQEKLKLFYLT